MGAVKVGGAIAAAKIERVIAVVEKAQSALLVGGMGEGIREADLQAVAHAFFDVDLQCVVGGDAGGLVGDRLGRVSDVRDAKIDIAALVIGQILLAIGQCLEIEIIVHQGVSVGVILA